MTSSSATAPSSTGTGSCPPGPWCGRGGGEHRGAAPRGERGPRARPPRGGRGGGGRGGEPVGMLQEGAMALVARLLPEMTDDDNYAALLAAQDRLLSLGITGWQDAIV